jgi:hypothetical protein
MRYKMNEKNIVKECIKEIKNNNPFKAHILYRKVKILKQLKILVTGFV